MTRHIMTFLAGTASCLLLAVDTSAQQRNVVVQGQPNPPAGYRFVGRNNEFVQRAPTMRPTGRTTGDATSSATLTQAREAALRRQLVEARARQARLEREVRRQQALRRAGFVGDPRGFYPAQIGYQPVITVLPSGVTMSTRGVVSPDGRSVRVNAAPFFSSIPAVHTFNPQTGEYRRIR